MDSLNNQQTVLMVDFGDQRLVTSKCCEWRPAWLMLDMATRDGDLTLGYLHRYPLDNPAELILQASGGGGLFSGWNLVAHSLLSTPFMRNNGKRMETIQFRPAPIRIHRTKSSISCNFDHPMSVDSEPSSPPAPSRGCTIVLYHKLYP